jgi:CheY-like chemotaxis protein
MITKKHKILVVDDELQFLELMKELLADEGYDVLTAESGEQGVDLPPKLWFQL